MSDNIIPLREIQFKKIKQILKTFENDIKSLEAEIVAIKQIIADARESRNSLLDEQDMIDISFNINNAHPYIGMFFGAMAAVNIFLEEE